MISLGILIIFSGGNDDVEWAGVGFMIVNHILNVTYLDSLGEFVADMDNNSVINILDIVL